MGARSKSMEGWTSFRHPPLLYSGRPLGYPSLHVTASLELQSLNTCLNVEVHSDEYVRSPTKT